MSSILFWNKLSLVTKNGLFTITLFENDHGPSVMNHYKQHRKRNSIKKRLCCLFSGIGWEVMLYPPYSPELAPSDYYLFRSLQNSLNGKSFNDNEAVKSHLVQFSADKDQNFYERGIMKLPEWWQKVIEENGKYIID